MDLDTKQAFYEPPTIRGVRFGRDGSVHVPSGATLVNCVIEGMSFRDRLRFLFSPVPRIYVGPRPAGRAPRSKSAIVVDERVFDVAVPREPTMVTPAPRMIRLPDLPNHYRCEQCDGIGNASLDGTIPSHSPTDCITSITHRLRQLEEAANK